MDTRFLPHNAHWESPVRFAELDPQLRALRRLPLAYRFPLLDRLPDRQPGIYSITGGRQIGKTTLIKQWMAELLTAGVSARAIVYLTGELIDDHHSLVRLVSDQLAEMVSAPRQFLLLDEITYIPDWDKGIKYLADTGALERAVVLLTGSDSALIRDARSRFPGRRGQADVADFHLYPLDFAEVLRLKGVLGAEPLPADWPGDESLIPTLFAEFDHYLMHGGFLTAINDLAAEQRIRPATLATYVDWIRGDVLKRGRNESSLREVLGAIHNRLGSQVTWNNLAQDLSIDHPATVASYMSLLADMDVIFIQPALVEDKLRAAPRKARKVHFTDPFIAHAVRSWLTPVADPFRELVGTAPREPHWGARLAESCAVTHVRRWFPTFYIKAAGEVDIAFVNHGRFWPVEVKWTRQIRPEELKQARKYRTARIWSRHEHPRTIGGLPVEPLPVALVRMAENQSES